MPGPRDYTTRTVMMLSHLSGGLCYCPGCPETLLREVNKEPHRISEIAHIRGAYPNSARYDDSMSDDQRRDIKNLILLCNPHHDIVDADEITYTAEVLHRWKSQRESNPREALKRLREVSPAGLRKIVAEGLQQHDANLLQAMGRLENNDREAASLLRSLIDELTEAYTRQREGLDPDVVYRLHSASLKLADTLDPDVVHQLNSASNKLSDMQETLDGIIEALPHLRRIPPNFGDYI